jgi:protein-tyrosine-phosphatase
MGKATGIKGLLDRLLKPNTPTEVRSVKSQIRQKVLDNPRLTGATEKDALAEINAMANKRIAEMKSASASTKTALPSAEANKRVKELKRQENIRTSESKSSINKSRNVSKADVMAANTAAMFRDMQKRIDAMPDGMRKKMMSDLLTAQEKKFKAEQGAELDTMTRKQTQSARDRKEFKGYTPRSPFSKGGMSKKRMAYKAGGYVNCGASMPGTQGKK